jgi:N-acetylmuramoyl-L-alanine amidase CwlA
MEIIKDLLPKSKYDLKCPYPMDAEFIVIHNAANKASAKNEIEYMKNSDTSTSFHFAVDDIEVRQGLPLDRNGWHAGDGNIGNGNRCGIGIEICYSYCQKQVNGKWVADEETWNAQYKAKFLKAEDNAAKLTAELLKERNWGISRVKKHQDFSNKYCPHRTLDLGWERFLDKVKGYMNEEKKLYRVQVGAFANVDNAKRLVAELKGKGYDAIIVEKTI